MFYFKVQAVCSKPKEDGNFFVRNKNIACGRNFIFVTNGRRQASWKRGIGTFAIQVPRPLGEPVDYQTVLTIDSRRFSGDVVVPLIIEGAKARLLPPFNQPRSGNIRLYKFGNRLDQGRGKNPIYLPIYLVRVWKDGRAGIYKYWLDRESIMANGSWIRLKVRCEKVYFTPCLNKEEAILEADLPKMAAAVGMAKFLMAARKSLLEQKESWPGTENRIAG